MMFSFHTMKPHKVWGIMRCYCRCFSADKSRFNSPGWSSLTVPRRSRCPCCPRSAATIAFLVLAVFPTTMPRLLFFPSRFMVLTLFTLVPSNIFSTASLIWLLVASVMNQECVLLLSHSVHTLLGNNRLKDDVIILNICHYAYTSSIVLYSSLCNYYCVVFQNVDIR